jgi:hypothetical protein
MIFAFACPLSICHRPKAKNTDAKKIKNIVMLFPGLNFFDFISKICICFKITQ